MARRDQAVRPQESLLFRIVAFLSRLQLGYLFRSKGTSRVYLVLFVFITGATALGTITITAYLTDLPLLFPPLGPSAFILFYTPLAVIASPRNVILSHSMAVTAGLSSLWLAGLVFPHMQPFEPSVLNWGRVAAIACAMGAIGVLMIATNSVHPPAAATALIAAMGYLHHPVQVVGLVTAVVLLSVEALLFNRVIGGLPYPLWRADPTVSRNYGVLAGIPEKGTNAWHQLAVRLFQRR
jgi:CBS-domain-containing membrane protein